MESFQKFVEWFLAMPVKVRQGAYVTIGCAGFLLALNTCSPVEAQTILFEDGSQIVVEIDENVYLTESDEVFILVPLEPVTSAGDPQQCDLSQLDPGCGGADLEAACALVQFGSPPACEED